MYNHFGRTSASTRFSGLPGLAPLLLALAVSHAYAAPVTVTGATGTAGADGTDATLHGSQGGAGQSVLVVLDQNADAFNSLTASGGLGGAGGNGYPGGWNDEAGGYVPAGAAGSGGAGGDAFGAVFTVAGAANGTALATVTGGNGGAAGATSDPFIYYDPSPSRYFGGNGGFASSAASAIATGAASVVAQAFAIGGNGGTPGFSYVSSGQPGTGGGAVAQAYGQSDTGSVAVTASAIGGNGGDSSSMGGGPRTPAAGADVTLVNAVAGKTTGALSLTQNAVAGTSGLSLLGYDSGTVGGAASSTLIFTDAEASALTGAVSASGGNGVAGDLLGQGGGGFANLELGSTRAGADVVGTMTAFGGAGGNGSLTFGPTLGNGGGAEARGIVSGLAAATGNAAATGGDAGAYSSYGGSATAQLGVTAGGLAIGTAQAFGGTGIGEIRGFFQVDGAASASLTLVGAGAKGTSTARGGGATSVLAASTTGVLAVDVASQATATTAGDVNATTLVSTGPGAAAVNAGAEADGGRYNSLATALVNVNAAGAITGTSIARGGSAVDAPYPANAGALSTIRGETGGAHAVTVSARALADVGAGGSAVAFFGDAYASAYGRSGSGAINVTAEARGGILGDAGGPGTAVRASATAVTEQAGGISNAHALAVGANASATALAQARSGSGQQMAFQATAVGAWGSYNSGGYASANATSQSGSLAFPSTSGPTYSITNVGTADNVTLAAGTSVAGGIANLVGVGMHAGAVDTASVIRQNSTGEFQFLTGAAEHVLIGFVSSAFADAGFEVLDLAISNNGTLVFSQSFTSLGEANLFFTDHVLDLGGFGGGTQNLSISSSLSFTQQSAYAFNYVIGTGLGTGSGISAVPEPSAWLMLSLGLGGVMLVARRRRGQRSA